MIIRCYMRASTTDQNADRARERLATFAQDKGHAVGAWYTEHASGRDATRRELERLLSDALPGDCLLVESIDRLSRLRPDDWRALRGRIESQGLHIVAVDLPLTHRVMDAEDVSSEMESAVLKATSGMIADLMAAFASADYEMRRQRQRDGIERAKALGAYQGRKPDEALHKRVIALLEGHSVRQTARLAGCAPSTVTRIKKQAQNA